MKNLPHTGKGIVEQIIYAACNFILILGHFFRLHAQQPKSTYRGTKAMGHLFGRG
jgi:hypothetical protein